MIVLDLISEIQYKNAEFSYLLLKALKFNDSIWSLLPSMTFLIFSMCLVHRLTHRYASRFRRNSYRDSVYREIAFQWLYLYVTRIWLYVVKGLRIGTIYFEYFIINTGGIKPNVYCLNIITFIIYMAVGCIPLLLSVSVFHSNNAADENILFWIPANRWTRTELGTAGRLMERPPDIVFTSDRYPHAYETKRSVSWEIPRNSSKVQVLRYCRSGYIRDQISSFDEMIHLE